MRFNADWPALRCAYVSLFRVQESDSSSRARGEHFKNWRRSALLPEATRDQTRRRGFDDRERVLPRGDPRATDGVRRRSTEAAWHQSGRQRGLMLPFASIMERLR